MNEQVKRNMELEFREWMKKTPKNVVGYRKDTVDGVLYSIEWVVKNENKEVEAEVVEEGYEEL